MENINIMGKRIVKLTEGDLERIVKRVVKEDNFFDMSFGDDSFDDFYDRSPELADLHDDVLYLTPYNLSRGIDVFEKILDAIETDGIELSNSARKMIESLKYDLGNMKDFNGRVSKLYNILSGGF